MKKFILSISIILLSLVTTAQVAKTVTIKTGGSLNSLLSKAETDTLKTLRLIGNIDARDIFFIRDSLPVLSALDLDSVQINAYSSYPAYEIPEFSFYNSTNGKSKTSLQSIKLPYNIKSIGKFAFYACSGLINSLAIPNSVTSVGDYAFYGCNGFSGTLTLSNSMTYIGKLVFYGCTGFSGNLNIPNSVKLIDTWAFANCSGFKGNLTIPGSVTLIGNNAFSNCTGFSGNLIIPYSVTSIGSNAFEGCSGFKGRLQISNSVTTIGAFAFSNCFGLKGSIHIPNSVISIGEEAFSYCSMFKDSLIISASVTVIGAKCFDHCSGLSKIFIAKTTPLTIFSNTFYAANKLTCQLIVPLGSLAAYQNANYWKDFKNISEAPIVSFNTLGGSLVNEQILLNSLLIIPEVPSKKGYNFAAWFKEPECVHAWKFNTDVITTNTTLYAKWNISSFTIHFDSNNGDKIDSIIANYNTTITGLKMPVLKGFTFAGWFKEPQCVNPWSFALDKVQTNTKLFAKWITNIYTVKYNTKIVGLGVASDNVSYNSKINAPMPFQFGYTLAGWFTDTACVNAWNFNSNVVTADTTLFAKWTINTYTVSFDSKDGSTVANTIANYNSIIIEPQKPTQMGYTFLGWYKESTYNTVWNFNTDVVPANIRLYAKWVINTFTVRFETKVGSTIDSLQANYNSKIKVPIAPTQPNSTFKGWYQDSTCTISWNFNSNKVTENTTLYAKWIPVGINIGANFKNEKELISVFPNPAIDIVTIKGNNLQMATISNMAGVIIQVQKLNGNNATIPIEDLKPGYYLITIKSSNRDSHTITLLKK
jgi:uncharacterized repeat protein (TIGR02543 family)